MKSIFLIEKYSEGNGTEIDEGKKYHLLLRGTMLNIITERFLSFHEERSVFLYIYLIYLLYD